ncbi:MAG: ABC transporter permease [Patescibacteria group bacterium]
MRFTDLFLLSTRMFKTRPLRTFLTILGVSVGIGTVLFLVSLGYGLQNAILSRITTADSLLSLDVAPGATDLITLSDEDIETIKQIPEVEEVSPVIHFSGQLMVDNIIGDGFIQAVDPSYFRLSGTSVKYGKTIENDNQGEIVVSSAGAKLFNLEPEQIIGKEAFLTLFIPVTTIDDSDSSGEEVTISKREEQYKIVGVIDDETLNYVFIPRKMISDLAITNYDQLKVKVSASEYMVGVRDKIINSGFLVSSLSDTIDQANKIFSVVQLILSLFGLVALVVSAIGMFNTMTIALLERINEIGIMRAIGVTRRDIKILFLMESVIMGFMGGVGGVLVGFFASEIANIGVNILAKTFGGQAIDLFYNPPWFIAVIIVFSTLIGFMTGIYPSNKAGKLNPLTALRYK